MLLNEQQLEIREMARSFALNEMVPFAPEWDRKRIVPHDTLKKMGQLGLMGVCVPEKWGGAGADFVSYVLALEALSYGDAGVANMMATTNSPVAAGIATFGNEEQKERLLRPLASGQTLGAFLLTEPHVGSEASSLRSTAARNDGYYVINGTKNFVTAGQSAGLAMVLAVTDAAAGKRGVSCFIVPTDSKGYVVTRHEDKLGHRTCDTCQIVLDNLEVGEENRLGEPGDGLRIAYSMLEGGRIGVAAESVGVAQAAFDAALAYSGERETFGKPIIEHQGVSFTLAEMATKIEVARQMYLYAAELKLNEKSCIKEASMAKLFASEMSEEVTTKAIQIHGGYGLVNDYPVEKFYRDVRVYQIYEGTSEIQKIVIGRELKKGT